MRVIEAFVKYIPREDIPDDAKWFMQDGESLFLKFSTNSEKPERSKTRDMWNRPGYNDSRYNSFLNVYSASSSDSKLSLLTRDELMRAYDLTEQGYTLWFGGSCPAEAGTLVDIVCDDGEVILAIGAICGIGRTSLGIPRGNVSWGLIDSPARVIAYRLSEVSCGDEEDLGIKDDSQKPRFSLVPAEALSDVIDVLEFGAKKYGAENWREVDHAQERYFNAAMRHLMAWRKGEASDNESGLPHLAHAATCLMFMIEGDKK